MLRQRVELACAAIAIAVCALAAFSTAAVMAGGRTSVLIRMDRREPMAEVASRNDTRFAFVQHEGHYDGVYFYAIATDPFGHGEAHRRIDQSAYRYGHGLLGVIAWALSFGHRSAIPNVLLGIELAATGIAAFFFSALARRDGRSPWWGLLVAANPGILFAVTVLTAEPLGIAFALGGVYAWENGRRVTGAGLLALAALTKEPFLFVAAGLFAHEVTQAILRKRADARAVSLLGVPALAFVGWQVYLRTVFHAWAILSGDGQLTAPFRGWSESARIAGGLAGSNDLGAQLGMAALPMVIALGAATVFAMVRSIRVTTAYQWMMLMFGALTFTLGWVVILYPKDLLRWASAIVLLVPAAMLGATRPSPAASDPSPDPSGG